MLESKDAYKIVRINYPDYKAKSCSEDNEGYVFVLIPENVPLNEMCFNSPCCSVNKFSGDIKDADVLRMIIEGHEWIRRVDLSELE